MSRNVLGRGSSVLALALSFSLLAVVPGGGSFAAAAESPAVSAVSSPDDLSPAVTEVDGETSGAEQFGSPALPDDVDELPEGADSVDPGSVPGTAWADLAGVPVEVRAADDVTVLPTSPEDAATTEPVAAVDAEPVPVEVSVEPSAAGRTPALFLAVQKAADAAVGEPLPSEEPPVSSLTASRLELEPDPDPVAPTEGTTDGPVGEPSPEPSDAVDGADAVELRVSYADFRYAFGGDWGSRLRVMAYPACYVTTPEEPGCSRGVVVPSVNDVGTETVTFSTADLDAVPFEVPVDGDEAVGPSPSAEPSGEPSPSSSQTPTEEQNGAGRPAPGAAVNALAPAATGSGGGTVYAMSASPAGQVGNFAAQPIKPSAAWQVGEGSGEFSYTYPFSLPAPAVGGSTPSLGLSYSSGAVDGMNMAENGQASMMGLGWDLSTAYVTREYARCKDDGHTGMDDLCWMTSGGDLVSQYSIVLNGHATKIVRDNASGRYRLQDDPGWRVGKVGQETPGPGDPDNADPTNEAFLVKAPDGTQYWFGWGYGSESVLTVPVFGDDPGEPCYHEYANTVEGSWCMQGWRWGLDKVVDRKGNVTLYNYARVQNYYAKFGDTANPKLYDRDGYLTSIRYGRSRSGSTVIQSEVALTKKPRCIAALTTSATCTGSTDAQSDPDGWPDVPADLICSSGTCANTSPSFFSTARYDTVATRRVSGSSSWDVDSYQLNFQLPSNANDKPGNQSLWLSSIQRTGMDGTDITLPKVVLEGTWLQNRVTVPYGGSKFLRLRVNSIRSETGARMDVEYGHDDGRTCDTAYVDTLGHDDSIRECYPRKLVNDNWEWWHKYVVKRVGLGDDRMGYRLGQAAAPSSPINPGRLRVLDYEYIGEPGWRYRPNPLNDPATQDETETWDDWRGYEKVVVHTREVGSNQVVDVGDGDIARRVVTRFRGLAGSKIEDPGVTVRSEEVVTLEGTYDDHSWLNGRVAEEITYSPTDVVMSRTSNEYKDVLTADHDFGLDGHYVYQSEQHVVPRTDAAERVTTWTVDAGASSELTLLGAPNTVKDDGGTPSTADDVCTDTDWVFNADTGLRVPSDVETRSSGCAGTVEQHTVTYYDGHTSVLTAPSEGDPTYTKVYPTGSESEAITTKTTWDGYGRVLRQYLPVVGGTSDADNAKYTAYEYNPGGSSHDLLIATRTTSPPPVATSGGELVSTQVLTYARSLVKDAGDANNNHTTATYDALGRPVDVWLPGRALANPSMTFTYRDLVDNEGRVGTTVLRTVAGGTAVYDTTYEYSDGWGRPIQTSTLNQGGTTPRMATMNAYDEAGRTWLSLAPFATAGVTEAVVPTLASTPHYTLSTFDALGRPTKVAELSNGSEKRWTKYTYSADADGIALMNGGDPDTAASVTKTRTTYTPKFEVESVSQYTNGNSSDANLDDGFASYTYTPTGLLHTITTPAYKDASNQVSNVTYTYTYDRLGRRTQAIDPDTGETNYAYDAMGNTTVVDDAMDNATVGKVETSYDRLSRPVLREKVLSSGARSDLARWTYDTATLGKGLPASTTSYTALGAQDLQFTSTVPAYTNRGYPTSTTQSYPASLTGEADAACTGSPAVCTRATTFGYDEMGNATTTGLPAVAGLGARTVSTTYGKHGTFTWMTTPGEGSSTRILAQVVYDELNRPLALYSEPAAATWTKALRRLYTWTGDDRLATLTAQSASKDSDVGGAATWYDHLKYTYTYDTAGNPVKVEGKRRDTAAAATTYGAWCYTFDGINRMATAKTVTATSSGAACTNGTVPPTSDVNTTSLTGAIYNLGYTYNQTRLAKVADLTAGSTAQTTLNYPTTATRPHAPTGLATTGTGNTNGLPTAGALSTYDPVGRATVWDPPGAGAHAYTYDVQGNLTKVDDTTAANADIDNAYDASGMRVARKADAGTTVYVAGAEITKPVSGTATGRRVFSAPGGTPLAVQATDGSDTGTLDDWDWLFADAQNTVRMTKNADTGAVTHHAYYPFGDPATTTSTLPGERGYLGKTHDPDGTVRLDHRSYDPGINTLTTPDPIFMPGDPQSTNPYAYSANNPLTFADPSGLAKVGCSSSDTGCSATESSLGGGTPPPPRTRKERAEDLASATLNASSPGHELWDKHASDAIFSFAMDDPTKLDVVTVAEHACAVSVDTWCSSDAAVVLYDLRISMIGPEALLGPELLKVPLVLRQFAGGSKDLVAGGRATKTVDDILPTPRVSSQGLQNHIDALYKGTTNPNRVGNGTTMDAIRNELATGVPTAGRMHSIKGQERLNGLNKWLRRNPDAPYHDRLVAQSLADELSLVLRGGG